MNFFSFAAGKASEKRRLAVVCSPGIATVYSLILDLNPTSFFFEINNGPAPLPNALKLPDVGNEMIPINASPYLPLSGFTRLNFKPAVRFPGRFEEF